MGSGRSLSTRRPVYINGVRYVKSSSTTTRIPLTELSRILQTSSSPETIVSSLNEMERSLFLSQNVLHPNAEYVYPFWKTCQHCSEPFLCHNHFQVVRNKACSKECARKMQSLKMVGRPSPRASPLLTCPVCGKRFRRSPTKRRGGRAPACSRQCRGKRDADLMVEIAKLGRAGWTVMSRASCRAKMTGAGNPAWKGGVTYRNRHGNYVSVRYVRCPAEFSMMARRDGYVMEHRLVVALLLKRPLTRSESVHHVNHNPLDNRPENLMLFPTNRAHKLYEHHGSPEPLWQGSSLSDTKESFGVSESTRGRSSPDGKEKSS